jgi:CDP-glucose 4,6-dehydratase
MVNQPVGTALTTFWCGRRVLVTGHTGFKGGWLSIWLARYGARLTGIALPAETTPALFHLTDIASIADSHYCDIRDPNTLHKLVSDAAPEVVFHLAAQPLVRASYLRPSETWATNVMGTANLLESIRHCPSIKAVVVITTDKCYENHEWVWGYRENDRLGGYDPYSASKAAVEILTSSYQRSFFSNGGPLIATARAGNVIGGGDWSEDRLIPDAARAVVAKQPILMRNPSATRPWQHVLEPLYGYLILAQQLLIGNDAAAGPFNFGPNRDGNRSVAEVLNALQTFWPELSIESATRDKAEASPHEANFLYLDSSKAGSALAWQPTWSFEKAIGMTADWYAAVRTDSSVARDLCHSQIEQFEKDTLGHDCRT